MLDTNKAINHIRKHFSEVSSKQFIENVKKYCPEIKKDESKKSLAKTQEDASSKQLLLFQPQPVPLPLNAYLACALTGLSPVQREQIVELSDLVDQICRSHEIDLYQPSHHTDPVKHANVPAESVFELDRERVLRSDLLIHLCHHPSTGAGEELAMASDALLPILLISHNQTRVSRMITGIPAFKVEIKYTDHDNLRSQLKDALIEIRPVLEQRKMAFSKYEVNIVGNTIRLLREDLGLTREEIANSTPRPTLTVERLRQIEESIDRVSNPSLIELRVIATILKTTVADLVEPNLDERLAANFQTWIFEKQAARVPGLSRKDLKRIARRVLRRVIDFLDDE